jgi:uncharacterized protein DUF3800
MLLRTPKALSMITEPPAEPKKEIFYFCDESSFIGEEYMAVAGLALAKSNLTSVTDTIKALHKDNNREEVKWTTTKSWNIEIRKSYIDCLVDLISKLQTHFHIRFAPFGQYEHTGHRRVYDTVSKMYYQLLLHRALRHYGSDYRLLIRPDDGECTSQLEQFVPALHAEASKKYGSENDCIASLVCVNSKREPLLQLLDVTLGALCAYRNRRHERPETRQAKRDLANYAHKAFGNRDLTRNHDSGRWLSIWNVVPKRRDPWS